MAIAATVFLTLGILIIGFGVLSMSNLFNMPFTGHQSDHAEHADFTDTRFQQGQIRIILLGAALLVVGIVLVSVMSI